MKRLLVFLGCLGVCGCGSNFVPAEETVCEPIVVYEQCEPVVEYVEKECPEPEPLTCMDATGYFEQFGDIDMQVRKCTWWLREGCPND